MYKNVLIVDTEKDLIQGFPSTLVETGFGLASAFDADLHALHLSDTLYSDDVLYSDEALSRPADYYSESKTERRANGVTVVKERKPGWLQFDYDCLVSGEALDELADGTGVSLIKSYRHEDGNRTKAIIEYIDECSIDIVLLGSYGTGIVGKHLGASLSEQVVSKTDIPVVTINLIDARAMEPLTEDTDEHDATTVGVDEVPEAVLVTIESTHLLPYQKPTAREQLLGAKVWTGASHQFEDRELRVAATTPLTDTAFGPHVVEIVPTTRIRFERRPVSVPEEPLRTVPRSSTAEFSLDDILIVNRGTSFNKSIVEHGIELATRSGGTLHFLYIGLMGGYSPFSSMGFIDRSISEEEFTEEVYREFVQKKYEKRGQRVVTQVLQRTNEAGVDVIVDVRPVMAAQPDAPILEYAREHDIDLVLVGTTEAKAIEQNDSLYKRFTKTLGRELAEHIGDSLPERLVKSSDVSVLTLNLGKQTRRRRTPVQA